MPWRRRRRRRAKGRKAKAGKIPRKTHRNHKDSRKAPWQPHTQGKTTEEEKAIESKTRYTKDIRRVSQLSCTVNEMITLMGGVEYNDNEGDEKDGYPKLNGSN